jgi:capsular polysaccharide biosynthesis protein
MNKTTDASAIFAPLWRRKWLILAAGILVAVGAYEGYKHKPTLFVAQTEINLNPGAEASTGGGGKKSKVNATSLDDEITIIQATVVEPVLRRLRREHNPSGGHAKIHAKGAGQSDFMVIIAEAHTAKGAATAANATARAYIAKRQRNYERSILIQIANLRRKIRRLEAIPSKSKKSAKTPGSTGAASAISSAAALQIASISNKVDELENTLTTKVISQLTPAKPGDSVRVVSSPKKNAEFGFILGILLACVAAFALSRIDRRLVSLAEIEAAF